MRNEYLKTNLDDNIEKFQKLLDNWKSKKLTIYSKVDFIKSFALSKLIFTAQMLPTLDDIVPKVKKILYNFIWGKKDKIRRRTMICPHSDAGINMVDVDSFFLSIKATWIKKILQSNRPWTYLPNLMALKIAPWNVILQMSFQQRCEMTCFQHLSIFYQQVIIIHFCKI